MPEPTDLKCIKLLLPRETALSGLAIGCRYDKPVTLVVSVVTFTRDNALTVFKEFQVIVGDSEGCLPRAGHSVPSQAPQTEGSRRGSGLTITKKEELVSLTWHCVDDLTYTHVFNQGSRT